MSGLEDAPVAESSAHAGPPTTMHSLARCKDFSPRGQNTHWSERHAVEEAILRMFDPDPKRLGAKADVRRVLLERARANDPIYYSDLVTAVPKLRMKGPSPPLYRLLDIIDEEEVGVRKGRIISAMAVHKKPHAPASEKPRVEPGKGFYETACTLFAKRLSRDAGSDEKYEFWVAERRAVVRWAQRQLEDT